MSDEQTTEAPVAKTTKSIVPSKYAGRYKNGGEDALAQALAAADIAVADVRMRRRHAVQARPCANWNPSAVRI